MAPRTFKIETTGDDSEVKAENALTLFRSIFKNAGEVRSRRPSP